MSSFDTPTQSHKVEHTLPGRLSFRRVSCAIGALCAAAWCGSLQAGGSPALVNGPGRREPRERHASTREAAPTAAVHANDGFVAVVVPRRSVELAPKLAGRLCELRAGLGDRVSAGDVIAVLEKRPVELEFVAANAAMREAQADIAKAEMELANAQRRYDRLLGMPDASSPYERTEARHARGVASENLNVVKARAERAAAEVEQLRHSLDSCEVRAPFDGAVAGTYQQMGAVVGPDIPIVRIISDQDLIIRFAAPEKESARIETGLPIVFRGRDGQVVLRGRTERAAPEVDAVSSYGIFEATLEAPVSDRTPVVGLDGRVTCLCHNPDANR